MGRKSWLRQGVLERAVAKSTRLLELAERQMGATQRVIGPA
jgi:hypothetical protein